MTKYSNDKELLESLALDKGNGMDRGEGKVEAGVFFSSRGFSHNIILIIERFLFGRYMIVCS